MRKTQFTTESGSVYLVSGDTLTRMVGGSGILRKDGEPVPVLQFGGLEVGEPATFLLDIRGDGIPTTRITSPVLEIKELD